MKIPFATSDSKLIEYGKTHKLDYILLRKAPNSKPIFP